MKTGLRHPRPDSEPVVDISVTYNTTSTYGRFIRTQPNLQVDDELLEGFKKKFAELASTHFSINLAGSGYFNDKFILDVEEAFTTCLSPNGTFEMFSDVPDHLNRPMGRYILKDKDKMFPKDKSVKEALQGGRPEGELEEMPDPDISFP